MMAYKTALGTVVQLGLKNTAVVSAWGKDPIGAIVQACHALEIPCFVIHDRDLPDEVEGEEDGLSPAQKAQATKNRRLAELKPKGLHMNRPNLEAVLDIAPNEKSAAAVFYKLRGKELQEIREEFSGLIPDDLLSFLGVDDTPSAEE